MKSLFGYGWPELIKTVVRSTNSFIGIPNFKGCSAGNMKSKGLKRLDFNPSANVILAHVRILIDHAETGTGIFSTFEMSRQ